MISKITTGYQITIPASFRKATNMKVGDYVDIQDQDNYLIITPAKIEDRDKLMAEFDSIFKEKPIKSELSKLSEEDLLKEVRKEIKKSRKNQK